MASNLGQMGSYCPKCGVAEHGADGCTPIAQPSSDPFWNPRPRADYANVSRRAYFAGYSDAYHAHPFGSGQHGDFSDYRVGFADGGDDLARSKAA